MRLNKFLSQNGACSRRDADKLIETGAVTIDGVTVRTPAPLLKGGETVAVNGEKVNVSRREKLWAFYKPQGLVTTHRDERNRPTAFQYLKERGIRERIVSVGRLDLNSEGLLLVTDNTSFAHYAESPRTGWKRVYRARVFGDANRLDFGKLAKGVTIGAIRYEGIACEIEKGEGALAKNTWLRLTLTEGKNREIRKIMESFGLAVNRLIRVNYGPYALGELKPGAFKAVDMVDFSGSA